MLLYYRFSSEHAGSYRQCALSSSALSLRETKQLLANECGLAGEYMRKIDFRIFIAGEKRKAQPQHNVGSNSNDAGGGGAGKEELVEVVDEHQMIHAYSHLVVQRVGLVGERVGGVYVHTLAKRQLSKEAWRSEEELFLQRTGAARAKKPVPPEWLCGLCGGVMTQPVLVKCLGSCTQSACRSCLETALRAARGSCPFCGAGFRQVIRNKRLEEIINHANLQEFEVPSASSAPHHGSSSEDSSHKGGANAAVLHQQTAAGKGERGGAARATHVKGASRDSGSPQADGEHGGESQAETPFHHFVYLLPQKNLQLMRARDMMLVDKSSALAAALDAAPSCSAQGGDDASAAAAGRASDAAGGRSARGGLSGAENSESDADLEGSDAFLVPLCVSGGGTSFSIGGFVRINSHSKVDVSTDRVAQSVVRQWQQLSDATSAGQGGGGGGEDYGASSDDIVVYRVNWLEKYGTMPMLPSRKQPLGGLVGASRRQAAAGFGLGGGGSNSGFVPGLIRRNALPFAALEVVVEPSKYEDVLASIRDYAQFGSRPTDPWQYPASNNTAAAAAPATAVSASATGAADAVSSASSAQGALSAAAHRAAHTAAGDTSGGTKEIYPPPVPPPPPPLPPGGAPLPSYHGHRVVPGETAAFPAEGGGASAGVAAGRPAASGTAAAVFGGIPTLHGNAGSLVTEQVTHSESEPHAGIPASLGPPPLDLYGRPGEEANPYMGYCAILPFLTEEQFWHIRRMQKKAIRLCGYKRPVWSSGTTSSSSTSSSSTSSKEGRERRRRTVRSYKRRRHRASSTESSTGSDSSDGSTKSEERHKGQESRVSSKGGCTCGPREVAPKEDAACGEKPTASPPAAVPSGESVSTPQTACESRVAEGETGNKNATDTAAAPSLQRRGSVSTPSARKNNVTLSTSARPRSVAGKPLPVVPPPLSTKHAGNLGSPRTGPFLSSKAKEDTTSTLRPVKSES